MYVSMYMNIDRIKLLLITVYIEDCLKMLNHLLKNNKKYKYKKTKTLHVEYQRLEVL